MGDFFNVDNKFFQGLGKIKGDAQWEKNYVYYDGDKERETETEDAEHTLYYIDDGGTWKLYDLDLWTW